MNWAREVKILCCIIMFVPLKQKDDFSFAGVPAHEERSAFIEKTLAYLVEIFLRFAFGDRALVHFQE